MGDEDVESTLLQIRECFVYKIPPRQTNAGYKAADWHLSQPLWTGRCVITAKGSMCTIKLENQTGELFAACPIVGSTQQCVESVTDSSRYFVIRIDDGQERSDAFDFNVALSDHEKHLRQQREQKAAAAKLGNAPKVDYSLKEGQTITVKIATKGGGVIGASGGGKHDDNGPAVLTALPPPPGSKARPQAHAAPAPAAVSHQDVGWGEFQAPVISKPPATSGNYFAAQPAAGSMYLVATAQPVAPVGQPMVQPVAGQPVAYPAGVAQTSLFGQPQQQPRPVSPQMMSPAVQTSPQMFAPPTAATPPQQSLFGQPQQQPAYFAPIAPPSPQVQQAAPTPGAPAPLQAGFISFTGAPVQQQWGAFQGGPAVAPGAPAPAAQQQPASLQQHQFKFN